MSNTPFKIWTVYQNPSDFPGQYVAREFVGESPSQEHISNSELQPVLDWIQQRSLLTEAQQYPVMIEREPNDDPCILYSFV